MKTRFAIVIEAPATGQTAIHALRAILKRLLRPHRFRCISAKEIPSQTESFPEGNPES
jgi:hypothetical protein